jgi:hypothetical protein
MTMTIEQLTDAIAARARELDDADRRLPHMVGTYWYLDREQELRNLQAMLNRLVQS